MGEEWESGSGKSFLHYYYFHRDGGIFSAAAAGTPAASIRAITGARASAADWQRFAREHELADLVKATPDRTLARVLEPRVEDVALDAVASALMREAQRRRAVFEQAQRRFGVDAGVFARDDKTLVVELDAATPYFLALTAFYPMLPSPRWRSWEPRSIGMNRAESPSPTPRSPMRA